MGRGRAKAKQTKVARELKYNAPQTDLERLQAELSGGGAPTRLIPERPSTDRVSADEDDDPYGSWSDADSRF
ncbi:DUF3073 domain-containing protein [Rhodococcus sp. IEGM 1408]|uniref:DUF3073 domain-containing protein n=1 Tax=Rhodococcus sp. IEGM 1408 TaxID=3082220 RepID=UPI002953DEC4|nr:DUF3073 domain-containing protein [Rhodococcus sp. IEGM 1408]MDV8002410.1 DUF3073 domain-containing protein [Rhodococcus sp. IEGM 1408]